MNKLLYILFIFLLISCNRYDKEDAGLQAEFADVKIDTTITRAEYKPQKIKYLFVHAIATDPNKGRWTVKRLMDFFTNERGWDRYGYHEYIDYDGRLWTLTPTNGDIFLGWDELTYNASGYNSVSMAISLEGGCEYKNGRLVAKDTFTPAQLAKLEERIKLYKAQLPGVLVLPHNAVNKSKACPSFDIKKLKI
jgi:hypothetical protein